MASSSHPTFSSDAKYFASCGNDGKLRIWETQKNVLLQEYTPNFHLNAPCSCLKWLCFSRNREDIESKGPKKKKKRESRDVGEYVIAMGTSHGKILLYSVASARVEGQLEGPHKNSAVTGLSWYPGTSLYSCGDVSIAEWDIFASQMKRTWKAGTEKLGCVAVSPDGQYVLSASRSIKLWNAATKQLLETFTGHPSNVLTLTFVPNPSSKVHYFVSTSKGDRFMNVWSSSFAKTAVVTMALESEPVGAVSLYEQENGTITLSTVTHNGAMQIFSHQLNGPSSKPLKPDHTVQVAMESSRSKDGVESNPSVDSIPIVSSLCVFKGEVTMAYGVGNFLAFESVVLNPKEKFQVLVRQDPRRMQKGSLAVSQVKTPDTEKAQYLPPSAANAVVSGVKRNHNRIAEVPMEERLENLSLSLARSDDRRTGMPRADHLAQLLLQALTSKDKAMLQTVLMRKEEDVMRNTVRKLPIQVIEPLLKELTTLLNGKTITAQAGARWLKVVLTIHSAHLMSNPSLVEILSPVIGLIETRLSVLPTLSRLSGRLELLSSQLDGASGPDENAAMLDMQSSVLLYQDADTSDEDADDNGVPVSESDDHWEELSDSDNDIEDDDVDGDVDGDDDDVEMAD